MADRIKGITIEIGGDTTKLSTALKGVNKEIKSTQDQLKDVDRLLKLDPKNTELLRQNQVLLKQAIPKNASNFTLLVFTFILSLLPRILQHHLPDQE